MLFEYLRVSQSFILNLYPETVQRTVSKDTVKLEESTILKPLILALLWSVQFSRDAGHQVQTNIHELVWYPDMETLYLIFIISYP